MLKWMTRFTYKIECQAAQAGTVYQLAAKYYEDIIHKEAILASIYMDDHILCVGGGLCPFSAILFHQITGAKVTAIDNNRLCIPKARQVIDRLGLGDDVHVLCQDGANHMDLSSYTVIHLALQVAPMDYVFSQVQKQAAAGTRLLVRRPKKTLNGVYSPLPNPQLAFCPYVAHKSRNIGKTLLYTKHAQHSLEDMMA